MELGLLALIVVILLLILKINNLSERSEKVQRENKLLVESQQKQQQVIEQQLSTISVLEQKKSDAQKRINGLLHEIFSLNETLKETERKLDFYKNIEKASGTLNEPTSSVPKSDIQLDSEQSSVFEEMENSHNNFFITGKAGTGKSFLLNAFREKTKKKTIVLAPTGIAALNVNGATLHTTFGYFNLVHLDIDEISAGTIRLKSEKRLVLKLVSTVIIDEISMVRADTFDKIDRILKVINNNDLPFGGKQILLFGDLFQLPPVTHTKEQEYLYDRYGGIHFFCADAYKQSGFHFRELSINHRQKDDAEYFELLNRVRDGSVTLQDIEMLNTKVVPDTSSYDLFTTLLPTKAEVEQLNESHIRQLDSPEYTYQAVITQDKYPNKNHALEALFPIADPLRLKKGVLVMMVANDPEHRWVNGTLGIVRNLSNGSISVSINENTYDIPIFEFSEQEVTYENGKLTYENVLTVAQYPIIPAYAITIHKSQGKTYQNIVCDIDRCFADGQAYVALSRCSHLSGLHLTQKISRASIKVNKSVLDFYHKNISQSPL